MSMTSGNVVGIHVVEGACTGIGDLMQFRGPALITRYDLPFVQAWQNLAHQASQTCYL